MIELNDQELAILKVLATEWETSGPPGFLTLVLAVMRGNAY